jgi:hypothetical protein
VLNAGGRPYGGATLVRGGTPSAGLRFAGDFGASPAEGAFTGVFFSLFGLTETDTTFDGRRIEKLRFPEHSLDIDRLDGTLVEPAGPRRADAVCALLAYRGSRPLTVRIVDRVRLDRRSAVS